MSNEIDANLMELTVQLRDRYQELNELVDTMIQSSDFSVDRLGGRMNDIRELEESLAPLRETFRQANETVPAALREPTGETIELVKGLLPKLAQLEKSTMEAADRLFPKIQASVRAVQMQRAYGATGRSS